MFWGYLILFILAVLTPELIRGETFYLGEEEAEAVTLFIVGCVAFVLYAIKDRSMLHYIREKLSLEREKHDMTRDLSDSYSYIGEVNRKMDLMKELILSLPEAANLFCDGRKKSPYRALSQTILLASKAEAFSLWIVHLGDRRIMKEIHEGKNNNCMMTPIGKLFVEERLFWEEDGCMIARSPKSIGSYAAYLMFPKTMNRHEDDEIFQAIATEALLYFFFEQVALTRVERRNMM